MRLFAIRLKSTRLVFIALLILSSFNFLSAQTELRHITASEDSPVNPDGTWNWEVLLSNRYDLIPSEELDKKVSKRIFDMVYQYQTDKKQAFEKIDKEHPESQREIEKWIIEQELQRQLSTLVAKDLPESLRKKLKDRAAQRFYQQHFVAELILKLDSLDLDRKQRMKISKLDSEARKEYQALYSDLLIKEGEKLFSKLDERQQTILWRLLGGKPSYKKRMSQKQFGTLAMWARKYYPGMSDSTFEGFLDLSRVLVNKKLTEAVDISKEQEAKCQRAYIDFFQYYKESMLSGERKEAAEAVKKYNKQIKKILLAHQLKFLNQQVCIDLLFRSPMNFLDTRFIRFELEIEPDQIEKLAEEYLKITTAGDKQLRELKKKLDNKAVKALNPKQRGIVELILKATE